MCCSLSPLASLLSSFFFSFFNSALTVRVYGGGYGGRRQRRGCDDWLPGDLGPGQSSRHVALHSRQTLVSVIEFTGIDTFDGLRTFCCARSFSRVLLNCLSRANGVYLPRINVAVRFFCSFNFLLYSSLVFYLLFFLRCAVFFFLFFLYCRCLSVYSFELRRVVLAYPSTALRSFLLIL